ncbi:putative histone-lysine N-methyltransferase 1 [Leptopilina boulardi]|uniref:putative histone-lysine N-methyltransferase 1 n=1 Tax=Leptopilina boulardi TaxID=63433 RepID=UPI0021F5ABF6|nr:putative histone-lysine N-methyltransferase 1 [Leptopilina boulardi]
MAMLAEPRRKQKWTLNPRGKQWSEDSNKFGQKMLEKMGWSSGKGLGAQEQGMTEHVRVKYKDDQAGIGFNKNDEDKQWTQHQESFNDLLMSLQKNQNMEQTEVMETKEITLSGTSLEEKSKQSKARVHYQKFTRGKDVNKYSSKDLANIFGKRTLDEEVKYEETEVEEEFHAEPIGTQDNTAGVLTIKGGNISEYFNNKMSLIKKENFNNVERKGDDDDDGDVDSESERYVGFGFNNIKTDQCGNHSQSEKISTNYAFENPCLDLNLSPQVIKPSRKRKNCGFDNEGLDLNYTDDKCDTPKKNKLENFEISVTTDCFVNPALNLDTPESNTCNGAEFEVTRNENNELSFDDSRRKKKKKNKKQRKSAEIIETGFDNCALNLNLPDIDEHKGAEYEVTRFQMGGGLDNNALDLSDENCGKKRVTFNDCVEYNTDVIKKKKGKTKLDKFEIQTNKIKRKKKKSSSNDLEEGGMVFINEALNVETISEEIHDNELNELNERKSRKQKRKKNRRMSNLETIEEAPEENEEDAICENRKTIKEKDVICDLEIITLNDTIESIEVIDDEIPKKSKKKKKKQEIIENVIDENEASGTKMKKNKKKDKENDKENEKEENVDNTEEKKKKKRKRKSSETCEFFLDLVEENVEIKENVEEVVQEKKSKKKRSRDQIIIEEEKIPEDFTPSKKQRLTDEVIESPQTISKKSKSVFKSMFLKTNINFKGSNINDIKGYGVD